MVKIIIKVEENDEGLQTRIVGAIERNPTAMETFTAVFLKAKISAVCEQGIVGLLDDHCNMSRIGDAIKSIEQKRGASDADTTAEAAPAEDTPPAAATAASETVNG